MKIMYILNITLNGVQPSRQCNCNKINSKGGKRSDFTLDVDQCQFCVMENVKF